MTRLCRTSGSRPVAVLLAASIILLPSSARAADVACARTYTADSDFDTGNLNNLNHDAPNNNQLQLNQVTEPFPFVNIAASARGTMIRIDVNSGDILGEYFTAPGGMGRDPSRTTVDKLGNVWVSNRGEASGGRGSVTRVGLPIGGTRGNVSDTGFDPHPAGQYLQPPFQYNTCVDRDGDGLIRTSRALGNVLPWTNEGGTDSNGGVLTANDECIINYTRVNGIATRTVAVDQNNDIWTGGINNAHEKVNGVTGATVPGTQFNLNCGGYGGLVDGNNVLWSARLGNGLLRFDADTLSGACLGNGSGDYGLAVDPQTGHIWQTYLEGDRIAKLNAGGGLITTYSHGNYYAQGVAVDGVGNVWVAHSLLGPSTSVGHLRTDGTFVGNVLLPGGVGPTGVAIDANGKVWVANINSNNAMRIDPNAGPIGGGGFPVGAVDMTVNLGTGAGPYNYSDMTGFVAIGVTAPSGTWTTVHDGGVAGTAWGTISWNGSTPAGTNIKVEVRASDAQSDLSSETFQEVTSGVSFCSLAVAGRYLEIRTTLSRDAGVAASPVLFDLSVACCNNPPEALCADRTVSAGPTSCLASASVDNGSVDPDGDSIVITQDPPGPYALGTTTVTLTATDDQGAADSCTALVKVVDDTPPQITCPALASANADAACRAAVPAVGPATVTDNCTAPGSLTVTQTPAPGTLLGPGTHTVAVSATDPSGNAASCTSAFTVIDNSPPVMSSSVAETSLWPPNHNLENVGLAVSSTDNCGVTSSGVYVFGDEDDEMATGDGNHSPDAKSLAPGTLRLRSERRGDANGRVYLLISTGSDTAGNTGYKCSTVVVPHSPNGSGMASVNAQAAAAIAHCNAHGTAPAGYFVVGDGPIIGPKQ
jgi:streptogramin lyase